MRISTIDLQTEKLALITSICNINSVSVIKTLRRSLDRMLAKQREEESEDYMSKDTILAGIRQGLLEVKEAQEKGLKRHSLQQLIDEL